MCVGGALWCGVDDATCRGAKRVKAFTEGGGRGGREEPEVPGGGG